MSSEDVAPTAGQYGSVTFLFGFRRCPLHSRGLIFTCYRLTLSLVLRRFLVYYSHCMIGFNTTTPMHCQVSPVPSRRARLTV